ncbi:MAG: sialate O-acetylesterase, partial [Eubacteriales bacterium]
VVTDGIAGGYSNYEVKVFAGGTMFADLTGVLFGALWLASGQSNMQYGLAQTYEGFEISKTGGTEEYIRALNVPALPEYNGSSDNLPFDVLQDVKGATWVKGTETWAIMGISAVAYFFACELKNKLDMPVGILNASLGGSSIYTWLSRQAIDSTPAVKDYLTATGRYITAEQWPSFKHSAFVDMTANYNKKIELLRHFAPDGMIWYQGESNISEPHGAYTDAMNLLQKSYSTLFGYTGSSMPFVLTQLASYMYGNDENSYNLVGNFNIQLAEIQAQNPTAIAVTTIYDVPLDWDTKKIDPNMGAVGAIHPMIKKPVGEKMAFAALGLAYDKRESYTAPFVKSVTIDGNSINVKFNNVGSGLAVKPSTFTSFPANAADTPLYGFAVAGANGIYEEAKAQITAPDTVKIWSDSIAVPVSASYAFSQVNDYSNLFATEGTNFTLGASAFITQRIDNAKHVQDKYWTTCDIDNIWRETGEPYFAPAFAADSKNTSVSFSTAEKISGTAALKVDYKIASNSKKIFSFGPVLSYKKNNITPTAFPGINRDYSLNSTVTFQVKNNSGRTVLLEEVRFYTNVMAWYTPFVKGTDSTVAAIPADGQWHTITLDLTKVCL